MFGLKNVFFNNQLDLVSCSALSGNGATLT